MHGYFEFTHNCFDNEYDEYYTGHIDTPFTYDQAVMILKELAGYLDTLDPDSFNQEDFFNAVNQDERCGCVAAHSIWKEDKQTKFPTGVNLEDSPAFRAAATISEYNNCDVCNHHDWSQYIFEVEDEGREHAEELGVRYYDATAKGGAARIREFLLMHGEFYTNKGFYASSDNLKDLV